MYNLLNLLTNDLQLYIYRFLRYIHSNRLDEVHLEYKKRFLSHFGGDDNPSFGMDWCPDDNNCDECVLANWRSSEWNGWKGRDYIWPIYVLEQHTYDPNKCGLYGNGIKLPKNYSI